MASVMSVDAYIQRQDRTFDTFRSKFSLGPPSPLREPDLNKSTSSSRRPQRLALKSTSTLQEILASAPAEHEINDSKEPVSPMRFAPQMRKFDLAPWESSTSDSAASEGDLAPPVYETIKPRSTKSTGKSSLFSKFRRVTSRTSSRTIIANAPLSPASATSSFQETQPTSPKTASVSPPLQSIDLPLSPAPSSTTPTTEARVSNELSTSTAIDNDVFTLAFQPINPNIAHLRHPVEAQSSPGSFKAISYECARPTRIIPRIDCDLSGTKQDRMSRMFDNLQF